MFRFGGGGDGAWVAWVRYGPPIGGLSDYWLGCRGAWGNFSIYRWVLTNARPGGINMPVLGRRTQTEDCLTQHLWVRGSSGAKPSTRCPITPPPHRSHTHAFSQRHTHHTCPAHRCYEVTRSSICQLPVRGDLELFANASVACIQDAKPDRWVVGQACVMPHPHPHPHLHPGRVQRCLKSLGWANSIPISATNNF